MSDSYLGLDQQYDIHLNVKPASIAAQVNTEVSDSVTELSLSWETVTDKCILIHKWVWWNLGLCHTVRCHWCVMISSFQQSFHSDGVYFNMFCLVSASLINLSFSQSFIFTLFCSDLHLLLQLQHRYSSSNWTLNFCSRLFEVTSQPYCSPVGSFEDMVSECWLCASLHGLSISILSQVLKSI